MVHTQVIVVSGVTASGKTTLVNELHAYMPNSKVLSFDDYNIDALPGAPAVGTPVKDAINQYDMTAFMQDFRLFYQDFSMLILDFPFGNRYEALEPYIDLTVYVKTPLDVVFARQILRDYHDKSTFDILEWTRQYLTIARPIFIDHENYVSQTADLIVDGTLSVVEEVHEVMANIDF